MRQDLKCGRAIGRRGTGLAVGCTDVVGPADGRVTSKSRLGEISALLGLVLNESGRVQGRLWRDDVVKDAVARGDCHWNGKVRTDPCRDCAHEKTKSQEGRRVHDDDC